MSIREHQDRDTTAARVVPIDIPSRADLWYRLQLARAVISHGRLDKRELLAILDGTGVEDLSRPAGGRSSS